MNKISRSMGFVAGVLALLVSLNATAATSVQTEDWKGQPDPATFNLGVLTGMGVLDSRAGYALLGTASMKIAKDGFVPDITDSVWLETELGPLFVYSTAAFMYSIHLRWDFRKDDAWTFYAIGGVSGDITGSSLGNRFILFPRFGIGAMYRIHDQILLRAELSRELIAVGVSVPF